MNIRSMKLLPLAMALLAVPMFAHGEDLMDAYHQALANDPALAQQLAQRNITGQSVPLARAGLLPHLSASLTLNQDNGGAGGSGVTTDAAGNPISTPSTGHVRSRSLSLKLSQTILDFSKYASLNAAQAQRASANATYRAALQNLIVRVTTAYFNVLTAKDQLRFAKANANALKRQYDQAEQRFKVGLSAITDVQDAKAHYESAVASRIVAKNQLNDMREALTQITGQPVDHLEVLSDTLPMAPPKPNNLGTWVKQAKLNNPRIAAQKFNVEAADDSVSVARDARLPTINANVSYNKNATWFQRGPYHRNTSGASIGLTLSVPLFSGGAIHARVKKSIYQRDAAQAALKKQRRLVVRNTRNYFRSVTSGISQVQAAKQAVISSESALKATRAGLNAGTQTIVEVLIAQRQLRSSRENYSQARHQFILNKLLLRQASGTLDVQDMKLVNALLEHPSAVEDVLGNSKASMGTPATQPAGDDSGSSDQ